MFEYLSPAELLSVNVSGKRSRDSEQPSDSDDELVDDEDDLVVPVAKRSKKAVNTKAYEEWKASIIVAREALKSSASGAQCTFLNLCCLPGNCHTCFLLTLVAHQRGVFSCNFNKYCGALCNYV